LRVRFGAAPCGAVLISLKRRKMRSVRLLLAALALSVGVVSLNAQHPADLIGELSKLLDTKLRPVIERVDNLQSQLGLLMSGKAAAGPVPASTNTVATKIPGPGPGPGATADGAASAPKGAGDGTARLPRTLEKQRWKEAFRSAKSQGYRIKGFYHVSAWRQFWHLILLDQLNILDGRRPHHTDYDIPYNDSSPSLIWGEPHWTSLLTAVDSLFLNVVGPDESHLKMVRDLVDKNATLHPKHRSKIQFHFNKTIGRSTFEHMSKDEKRRVMAANKPPLSEAEVSTVTALQDYCVEENRAGRKAFVFYIHNKGACCFPRNSKVRDQWPVAGWRDVMNTFNIEFPSICLRALLAGYSTCGYGSQLGHYTGNFWWADCGHVAALPPLWSKFDAYAVEYLIMNVSLVNKDVFERNCAYEAYHCLDGRIDHYAQHCPRNDYMDTVNNFVAANAVLPRIKNSKVDLSDPKQADFCRSAWRKGKYIDQPGWRDSDRKNIWREP